MSCLYQARLADLYSSYRSKQRSPQELPWPAMPWKAAALLARLVSMSPRPRSSISDSSLTRGLRTLFQSGGHVWQEHQTQDALHARFTTETACTVPKARSSLPGTYHVWLSKVSHVVAAAACHLVQDCTKVEYRVEIYSDDAPRHVAIKAAAGLVCNNISHDHSLAWLEDSTAILVPHSLPQPPSAFAASQSVMPVDHQAVRHLRLDRE